MTNKIIFISAVVLSVFVAGCSQDASVSENTASVKQAAESQSVAVTAAAEPQAVAMGGAPAAEGQGMGMAGAMGMGPPPRMPASDSVPDSILSYKTVGDKELKLHLFNPDGHSATSQSPVLIFMHGGGFRRGSPQQGYEIADRFMPLGLVVVAPEYRLMDQPERTLDEIISDGKSTVRYLRENAGSLGIDSDRIAISGHSAGAFLSLATTVIDKFDAPNENLDISSVPNSMILWSVGIEEEDDPENSFVPDGSTIEDFSPANYIRAGLPSAFFIHGEADPGTPYQPAKEYSLAYAAAGNQSEFYLVEGADHFFATAEHRTELFGAIETYLRKIGFTDQD